MKRKWAMRRVAAGDYLQPSDDLTRLWRFHTHRDGTHHGLVDVRFRDRVFWRVVWMPWDPDVFAAAAAELPDPWSPPWVEADWYVPTRTACLDVAARFTS